MSVIAPLRILTDLVEINPHLAELIYWNLYQKIQSCQLLEEV